MPGEVVTARRVVASGWHLWDGAPALAVTVLVNGEVGGAGAVGAVDRPDVAEAVGDDGAGRSGWTVDVDLGAVSGEAELTVVVWGAPDAEPVRLPPVPLHVGPGPLPDDGVDGELSSPEDGSTVVGDVLEIGGWCLFDGSRVARVDVTVDGRPMDRARPFVDRPDVAARSSHPDAPVAGFEALVARGEHGAGGESLVTVEVTSLDGRRWRSPTHRVRWIPDPPGGGPGDLDGPRRGRRRRRRAGTRVLDRLRPGGSRVVAVTHNLSYGGGQLWLLELLNQIAAHTELACTVVAFEGGPLGDVLEELGVDVHVTGPVPVGDTDAYEGRVLELALLMRGMGAGVVLANTLGVFAAVDAAERAGIPSLWAIHESFEPAVYRHVCWGPAGMDPAVRACFDRSFGQARALIFEARSTSEIFASLCPPARRFVVDYGVDLANIDAYRTSVDRDSIRSTEGLDDDDLVVVLVGVLEPRKAQAAMVAAFDELAPVHRRLRLVLVGAGDGRYTEAVRDQLDRISNGDRVTLIPVEADVRRWYTAADLLVCASDIESLPRTILEAMAFEVPVVSTDVFGIAELITDGRTGWLTRPRDLEGLVGILETVLHRTATERRRVGTAARALVARRHDARGYGCTVARALALLVEDPDHDVASILSSADGGARHGHRGGHRSGADEDRTAGREGRPTRRER